jgi:tryptophanyl-tRNA synthetase
VMKAVTDAGPTEANQPIPQTIQNLFALMKVVSGEEALNFYTEKWNDASIRYGDMKKQLAEDMVKFMQPFSERIAAIEAQPEYVAKVIRLGKEKARASADKTIKEVRNIIGFNNI